MDLLSSCGNALEALATLRDLNHLAVVSAIYLLGDLDGKKC